jgi:hypothetical protein
MATRALRGRCKTIDKIRLFGMSEMRGRSACAEKSRASAHSILQQGSFYCAANPVQNNFA